MTRLVVALPAEARPVVSHFRLESMGGGGPYRRYSGKGVELVVSGIGKVASAAAAAYLFASSGDERDRPWINLGIAGSRERPIGEACLAHKVVDEATGRSWYPPLVFDPPCPTAAVRTVDRPQTELAGGDLFEMEAAGFCETAARFSTAELLHVLKVVSDNGPSDLPALSAARVSELVEGALGALEALITSTTEISAELRARAAPPEGLADFVGRWHFTVTEQRRLERLLRRLEVLESGHRTDLAGLDSLRSGGAVLERLEERLAAIPPSVR